MPSGEGFPAAAVGAVCPRGREAWQLGRGEEFGREDRSDQINTWR